MRPAEPPRRSLARDARTLPNLLTLLRIALVLAGAGLFSAGAPGWGIVLAGLGGASDVVDGAVARATGQVTRLGEILDQFSDVVFEALLLMMLVKASFIPTAVFVAYLTRELWVSSIRRFMAGERRNIVSSRVGKWKSVFLMSSFLPSFVAVAGLWPAGHDALAAAGRGGILVALVLSYLSGWNYTRQFFYAYDEGVRS